MIKKILLFFSKNKANDIIVKKQEAIANLKKESANALNIVTSTINSLTTINEKIEVTMAEIREAQDVLIKTNAECIEAKKANSKVIDKFKSLISD